MDGILRLPADPLAARQARGVISRVCEHAGIGNGREYDAELLTSELATNAVRHAGSDLELSWAVDTDALRVAITDFGTGVPSMKRPDPGDGDGDVPVGGRGLWLVNELADRWGVDLGDSAKTVWFELAARHAEAATG